jgi:hypothetical protein
MLSSQSLNYGLKIKMKGRRMQEKILETKKILEISLEAMIVNILHATYAKSPDMQRKTVGIAESQYATIARNLATWRTTVVTRISIKQILQESHDHGEGSWFLDSGCNNHMAKDSSIFKDNDNTVKVKV